MNGCKSQVADNNGTVLAFVKNAPCYDMSLQPINFSGIALKSQTLAMMTTECPFVLHSLDMTHRSVLLEQRRLIQPEQQPPTIQAHLCKICTALHHTGQLLVRNASNQMSEKSSSHIFLHENKVLCRGQSAPQKKQRQQAWGNTVGVLKPTFLRRQSKTKLYAQRRCIHLRL